MHKNHELSILEDQLEDPLDQLDADGLAETPPPDPEMMLTLLVSTDASQRMLAARAFCELQEERAIPHLIQLLADVCPLVRVSAAYALGRNTHLDAVAPLIHLLENDWNGYVRKGVAWPGQLSRSPCLVSPDPCLENGYFWRYVFGQRVVWPKSQV